MINKTVLISLLITNILNYRELEDIIRRAGNVGINRQSCGKGFSINQGCRRASSAYILSNIDKCTEIRFAGSYSSNFFIKSIPYQ